MAGMQSDNRFRALLPARAFFVCVSAVSVWLLLGPAVATADPASDDYNLAAGLYKQKRWKLAAGAFQKFLKDHPKHTKVQLARLHYGLTLVNLEQYRDARIQLRGFVKDYPRSRYLPDAMYRVAESSYLLDDLKSAELELRTFVTKYPQNDLAEWALPYLGDAQLRLDKPQLAAESFKQALDRYPNSRMAEDTKFGLARSLEALKKPTEAANLYKQVAANRDGTLAARAQLKLGTLYFDLGKYSEAANAYIVLQQKFTESGLVPLARLNAGYSYYQTGDFRRAITQFDLAAKDKQQATTATYWKGVSHKGLKEYETASAVLKAVFEADSKAPLAESILHQWADSELRIGRYDSARTLFLKVVDGWPQGDLADDCLHFAAEAALRDSRLDEADKLLARFTRQYSNSPLRMHHQLLQGRVLDAKGGEANWKAAAARFQKVLDESQTPHTQSLARFRLARSWEKLGDHARVVTIVGPLAEQAKKQGGSSEFIDALVLQGTSLLALEKYDDAQTAMADYLKLRPTGKQAAQALATLALAESHRGNKRAAQSHQSLLASKYPNSPLVTPTTYQLAEIAYQSKDWSWAASLFGSVAKKGTDSGYYPQALSGLAWSQHQQKQYREAAATFGRVVKEFSDDNRLASEAAYMRGKSLQDANLQADAAAAYALAFEKFAPPGRSPAGAEQQGSAYYAFRAGLQAARVLRTMKNKVKEADAAYEVVFKRFPEPKSLDKLLDEWALLNYEAGRYDRSDEIFRRLIEQTPSSSLVDNARLSLAESDLVAGRLDVAKKSLLELQSSPKSDEQVQQISLSHLMEIAVEQKNWKDVQQASERLTSRFPKSKFRWQALFHLGEAHLQRNNVAEAQKTLLEIKSEKDNPAVAKADWFPRMWVLLAETFLRTKKYDDVQHTVEEFRVWDSKSAFLYQADEILGRSLKNQAKFDDARAAFRRAISGGGADKTETAAKSQFLLAETYLTQKKYESALQEYLKVYYLYKYPQWQAPALYQAAQCDEALSQWKTAVKAYEDLLADFPKSEFATKAKMKLPAARRKAAG